MKLKFLLYYAPLHPLDRLGLFSTGWRISFFVRFFSEVSALPFRFKKKKEDSCLLIRHTIEILRQFWYCYPSGFLYMPWDTHTFINWGFCWGHTGQKNSNKILTVGNPNRIMKRIEMACGLIIKRWYLFEENNCILQARITVY